MLVMIICYTAMSRELRRTKAIGEMTPAQQDSIRSKRKVSFLAMSPVWTLTAVNVATDCDDLYDISGSDPEEKTKLKNGPEAVKF